MADSSNALVRLDGGLATELQRAGVTLREPWWTTGVLRVETDRRRLSDIHQRYLAAGAQVITANTFRTNLRTLRQTDLDPAGQAWMVHAAIGVAMAARNLAGTGRTRIVASVAPVEDCYRPDLVPSDEELRAEHAWLATELSRSGVQHVLIETMNTTREALIALEEAQKTGMRAWVSFVCDDEFSLLSGESLAAAATAVERAGADAVLVNCAPLAQTEGSIRVLRDAVSLPVGAYPNLEDRSGSPRWQHVERVFPVAVEPPAFAETAHRWHTELGARIIGGCCGSTPDHIAALSAANLTRVG
ncbi:homocysteine methyltransferase [Actinosynnema sp. ALI-1.44]|uniref:homocysteine S-methyltransferase family protein n=1 Tax=Actinosynnema sp. ALI-1.44 TaxID=1933779 RepID=UPI00097BBFEB|nr:homocysteine S-methyltransferase family protein [Actinosynnema sp. ALI-1.44]ONI76332.1 homocysteine methyltransferase [Actinosynnema sp. ALI-1.44]